ncbi:MAG: ABC transporter permease [Lachnospiraceae bacterium]|nr:ABC transporter permease [Lachnospiraceae bacterium]
MIASLKAEWYKLTHRAYPFIFLLLCMGCAMIIALVTKLILPMMEHFNMGYDAGQVLDMGFYASSSIVWYLLIITEDIAFTSEYKFRTMKNVITRGENRTKLYLSRLFMACMVLALGVVLVTLTYMVSVRIFYGADPTLTLDGYADLTKQVLCGLFLWLGSQSLIHMMAFLIQNEMLWGCGYLAIFSFLPNGVWILKSVFGDNVALDLFSDALLTTQMTNLVNDGVQDAGTILTCFLMGAAYMIVTTVIGILFFRRKEVR